MEKHLTEKLGLAKGGFPREEALQLSPTASRGCSAQSYGKGTSEKWYIALQGLGQEHYLQIGKAHTICDGKKARLRQDSRVLIQMRPLPSPGTLFLSGFMPRAQCTHLGSGNTGEAVRSAR